MGYSNCSELGNEEQAGYQRIHSMPRSIKECSAAGKGKPCNGFRREDASGPIFRRAT